MRQTYSIGILGYGRFGKLFYDILTRQSPLQFKSVRVFDKTAHPQADIEFVSLQQALQADVLIPCVPISLFENCVRDIVRKVGAQPKILLDVCSVKVRPAEVMRQYAPASFQLIASHPLFGPDSASDGLAGLTMVMHPLRVDPVVFDEFVDFFQQLKLRVIRMTPDEHDLAMMHSQAFTHLIGRIGEKLDLKPTGVDSTGFQQLLKIQKYVVNDRMQLFHDMISYNPYGLEMVAEVKRALEEIETYLNT